MSRNGALNKNLNFEDHFKIKHNKSNYVYFLINLHFSNPNNLSGIENYVWKKLGQQNNSWIPRDKLKWGR